MFAKIAQLFRIPDLRRKIFIVLGWLVVFRVLAAIPISGVDPARLRSFLESNQLFGFFNVLSGGGLSNLSVIMLGVGPYITATIIMQLLTMIFPRLKELYYEEGSVGRAKFNRMSRYLTVPLAALQAYGFLNLLINQGAIAALPLFAVIQNVILVTAGSVLLMWVGELIGEQKIGNGVSLIIFAGIVAGIPAALRNAIATFSPERITTYAAFVVLSILIIAGVVFVSQGERKIPVSYSKRIRGNRMYGGATSYLPLKVNQAGVIPIIFAISLLLFPQFFAQMIAIFSRDLSIKINAIVTQLFANQIIYATAYFILVFIFTYFYTAITFDPKEISKNLQRSGGFIPGIRPGDPSGTFLAKITHRITLFGAIFLGIVAILPNLTQILTGVQFLTIGGTALLIVVSVALETVNQVNSQLVMREYEGIQ